MLEARIARAFFVLLGRRGVELAPDGRTCLGSALLMENNLGRSFSASSTLLVNFSKPGVENDLLPMASNRTVSLQGGLLCR